MKNLYFIGNYCNVVKTAANSIYSLQINEDLDIFSELPAELFMKDSNEQIYNTLLKFKKSYFDYVLNRSVTNRLPKLHYSVDEDGSRLIQMSSKWTGGNASLYFSFEENTSESSFGMIWNDSVKMDFQTRSCSLELNDLNEIIRDALEFIFKVY